MYHVLVVKRFAKENKSFVHSFITETCVYNLVYNVHLTLIYILGNNSIAHMLNVEEI